MTTTQDTQSPTHVIIVLAVALVLLLFTLIWLGCRPQAAAVPVVSVGTPANQIAAVKPRSGSKGACKITADQGKDL